MILWSCATYIMQMPCTSVCVLSHHSIAGVLSPLLIFLAWCLLLSCSSSWHFGLIPEIFESLCLSYKQGAHQQHLNFSNQGTAVLYPST
ncbi:hypothetical protein QBC43DRAFT_314115 [Cladorrhinum sp. PSN259]|nr:hypothetical protein QBC43DRAFT_314115 [Cladorrhinum sp. PSN259]